MKREVLSIIVTIVFIGALHFFLSRGMVSLSEVSIALVSFLVGGIFLILYWGFKPKIDSFIKGKPEIIVTPKKEDSEKFKEIHVRLRDGIEKIRARFYFITIKNASGPTIKDLEAHFKATYFKTTNVKRALVPDGRFLMIMSTRSDHLTLHTRGLSKELFRKWYEEDGLRIQLLNTDDGKLASRKIVLHQGDIGETFGLFFTLEGYRVLTIPGIETRVNVGMPCSFRIDLYLEGDTFPSQCVASFQVDADRWDSFEVKPLKKA